MIQKATTNALFDARKMIRPLRASLRRLLQELIRTNSVAVPPEGNETPAQLVLKDFLSQYGIRSNIYEVGPILAKSNPPIFRSRDYAGRKNLSACLEGRGTGKSLLLNGHMDTVPPGKSKWSASPWSGHIRSGKVFGLGAFDMKGGLVANAAVICALSRSGVRLGGDLFLESVIDEEWGGGGGTFAARLRGATADACVIPEGTHLEIYRASRGGFIVDLSVEAGDPKSYFSISEVVSPAASLGRILGWVDSWAKRRFAVQSRGAYEGILDPAPVQVLAIEANSLDPEVPLSVPTRATLRVYFQFLPSEDVNAVVREIELSLRSFSEEDPFFSRHPIQWSPLLELTLQGHELPANHPWIQCMTESVANVLRRAPVISAAPYPCDAGLMQQRFGIPTLLFGPTGGGAHNPNEYVEFDSVIQTAEAILGAALSWAGA